LPKVLSFYPLSPQRGERVRVRGDRKKLLATSINLPNPKSLLDIKAGTCLISKG
jgi:hypothetical protein